MMLQTSWEFVLLRHKKKMNSPLFWLNIFRLMINACGAVDIISTRDKIKQTKLGVFSIGKASG
jgi:hypothetical protein